MNVEKIRIAKDSKPFSKGDAFFWITVAVVITALCLAFFLTRKTGDTVKIESPTVNATYPLSVNRRVSIGSLTVVIDEGRVSVVDADCPDKICEQGAISQTGQSIVCLPNRVVIVVLDDSLDGVVG